jgi:hypothetical protein
MNYNHKTILIAATIVTVSIAYLFYRTDNSYEAESQPLDTSSTTVDVSAIDSNQFLTVAEIFAEFQENKVAFDKKNDEKVFEFEGTISEITNTFDCARIRFRINDENGDFVGYAECSNCPQNHDQWSEEVSKVIEGQDVRIKGRYSKILSSRLNLEFYRCHITKSY